MNRKEEMAAVALEVGYADTSYHDWLAELTQEKRVLRYLEVGAHKGSTLLYVLEANPLAMAWIIDDFQISTGVELCDNIAHLGFRRRVRVVEGNDLENIPHAMAEFRPDFVHLDADHSTGGLLAELGLVTAAVIKPKTIVVHDFIDPRVKEAIDMFYIENWDYERQDIMHVYNHAVLFQLKDGV